MVLEQMILKYWFDSWQEMPEDRSGDKQWTGTPKPFPKQESVQKHTKQSIVTTEFRFTLKVENVATRKGF